MVGWVFAHYGVAETQLEIPLLIHFAPPRDRM